MAGQLSITYLFDSTTLWGGNKVALEQAEELSDLGYRVRLLSRDAGPTWYPLRSPVVRVPDFSAATIPESDVIIGTFWTTVKAAYESKRGAAVHLCQGYEGNFREYAGLKKEIDEVYSLPIPKLTTSPHLGPFLRERFGSETHFIGQMLNRDIFYPADAAGDRIRRDFRILVVGPFEADVKNIPVALRGISLARKKFHLPLKLIRVSQFSLSREEEEIIRPDIYHFHVPHFSMGEIYRSADLCISMSKEEEGFGLPALEAMGCGVPTILSRISSHTSFDDPPDYALFSEPSDPDALAGAIHSVFSDRLLRERLVRRGLFVAGKFTRESVLKRLTGALAEIISHDS